ncbi:MAG: DUF748 domain-containing protein [Gammaproteobacteria bacterium]|nr:DUF748 domain-containing protein [Gammaproteobacteria bacterium]
MSDAAIDIASFSTKQRRLWEIAGWKLAGKPASKFQWHWLLKTAQLNRVEVCYLHRPEWATPSCARIDTLTVQDLLISAQRTETEPLKLEIGANNLQLENLIVRDIGSDTPRMALVDLHITEGYYKLPDNRLTFAKVKSHKFASCPPKRWAKALPALGNLIGHCTSAQQLQITGPMAFTFGREAQVDWRQVNGRGISLRYNNKRFPNWHAETIELNNFFYQRNENQLHWQSSNATGFDWCPKFWRTQMYHYCLRANSLQLPNTVSFNWQQHFQLLIGSVDSKQIQLVDLANNNPSIEPVIADHTHLDALQYHANQRLLKLNNLSINRIKGCIPERLWKDGAYCVQLKELLLPTSGKLYFPIETATQDQDWGFASGVASLQFFSISRPENTDQNTKLLSLNNLNWHKIRLFRDSYPLEIHSLNLDKFSGCIPNTLLKGGINNLCAKVNKLYSRGNFEFSFKENQYAIWGDFSLAYLQLADQLLPGSGLHLNHLKIGRGKFYHQEKNKSYTYKNIHISNEFLSDIKKSIKLEFNLSYFYLHWINGCLSENWIHLLYTKKQNMPVCFAAHKINQHKDTSISWGHGIRISASDIIAHEARISTHNNNKLLELKNIKLPIANVKFDTANDTYHIKIPNISANKLYFCWNRASCIDLKQLNTGNRFSLIKNFYRLSTNISDFTVEKMKILNSENMLALKLINLSVPKVNFQLLRAYNNSANWNIHKLRAKVLEICWPREPISLQTNKPPAQRNHLPRCFTGKNLYSASTDNGEGVTLESLQLRHSPTEPVDLTLKDLQLNRVAISQHNNDALNLNLHNLKVAHLSGCGLRNWLPASILDRGWSSCLRGQKLHLSGDNLIHLGKIETQSAAENETTLLQLGPLQTESIALLNTTTESTSAQSVKTAQISLQQLNWQAMNWPGGAQVQLIDVKIHHLRGCLPKKDQRKHCAELDQLTLTGHQQLSSPRIFHSDGEITIQNFNYHQGRKKLLKFSLLKLNKLTIHNQKLGLQSAELTDLKGCLREFKLGERHLAPCYYVARIATYSANKIPFSRLAQQRVHNFFIEDLRVRQTTANARKAKNLLKIKQVKTDSLILGQDFIETKNLKLAAISSCIPSSNQKGIDFCISLDSVYANAHYAFSADQLSLQQLNFKSLKLLNSQGEKVLQADSATVRDLQADKKNVQFSALELLESKFFKREEQAKSFKRHKWHTELGTLRIRAFDLNLDHSYLKLGTIELLRPKSILVRNIFGNLELWEDTRSKNLINLELDSTTGKKYSAKKNSRKRFNYHIAEAYLDNGELLWIDNSKKRNARLSITDINFLLRNFSSYPEVQPAVLVGNAHPGEFGELQLGGYIHFDDTQLWDADILGYLVSINLIPATPYMKELLGYKILQGQLDSVMDVDVRTNIVDANAKVVLNKMKIRAVHDSSKLPIKKYIIPLNIALFLLENGQGTVKFNLPVTGDLYDPNFSFRFIFSDLLQRAILDTLSGFFTPVGIYRLAKFAWARFKAVKFAAVEFAPGEFRLNAETRAALTNTVLKMNANPKTRPGICGISTALDLQALHPKFGAKFTEKNSDLAASYLSPPQHMLLQMQRLAQRRSNRVQRFLIQSGLTSENFIQCAPDYIGNGSGRPRVEISN